MSKRDYYEILGLAKNASEDDIKKSYKRLASKYHPDKYPPGAEQQAAEEKFKEAKEAYETLSDTEKRRHYDSFGHDSGPQFTRRHTTSNQSFDHREFEELFKHAFARGGFNFEEGLSGTPKTPSFSINLSLEHAYTGKIVRVDQATTINIPRGVRSGTKMYVGGKIYRVDIQPHPKFKRNNDDLLINVEIGAIEAMLGVGAVLEHLDGVKLQFTIPPGIQHGQVVRLANKGMKNPEFDKDGDLLIRIFIKIPKGLSDTEKASLKTITHRETINI